MLFSYLFIVHSENPFPLLLLAYAEKWAPIMDFHHSLKLYIKLILKSLLKLIQGFLSIFSFVT